MKTNSVRSNWVFLLLGIVLIGALIAAANVYRSLDQSYGAALQAQSTLDSICEGCAFVRIQSQFQAGSCPEAARRVEEALASRVAILNEHRATGDEDQRALVEVFVKFVSRHQPQNLAVSSSRHRGNGMPGD